MCLPDFCLLLYPSHRSLNRSRLPVVHRCLLSRPSWLGFEPSRVPSAATYGKKKNYCQPFSLCYFPMMDDKQYPEYVRGRVGFLLLVETVLDSRLLFSCYVIFVSVSGRLHVFHVKDSELEPVCPLMGGHTSTVRCLQWDYKVSI